MTFDEGSSSSSSATTQHPHVRNVAARTTPAAAASTHSRTMLVLVCCVVIFTSTTIGTTAAAGESSRQKRGGGGGGVEAGSQVYYNSQDSAERETSQDADISRLLLKHLRFRQLPESGRAINTPDYSSPNSGHKRREQRMLVSNLAALLSGLRDRQSEANVRMPSLRFGK